MEENKKLNGNYDDESLNLEGIIGGKRAKKKSKKSSRRGAKQKGGEQYEQYDNMEGGKKKRLKKKVKRSIKNYSTGFIMRKLSSPKVFLKSIC